MHGRKTGLKSFRIENDLLEKLRLAARREGVSENAFVEGLLRQRLRMDPIIHAFPSIVVAKETFEQIVGMTNAHGLEMAGFTAGKKSFSLAKELFASNGIRLDLPTYLVDVLGESGWFAIEGADVFPERITLRHEYGLKWSIFLRSFILGAYSVTSKDKLVIRLEDSYLSLRFPRADAPQPMVEPRA